VFTESNFELFVFLSLAVVPDYRRGAGGQFVASIATGGSAAKMRSGAVVATMFGGHLIPLAVVAVVPAAMAITTGLMCKKIGISLFAVKPIRRSF
tara:strand:+ start:360 stop:644 length:285 start_codon:yes stop_codon:yes gene_type:complete